MARAILTGILLFAATVMSVSAQQADQSAVQRWLHIRVVESGPEGESVRVNLPLELVASMMPLIESEGFDHGRIHAHMDEMHDVDLPKLIAALRKAQDGEYITVDGPREKVRVSKKNDIMFIHVVGDSEKVDVQIRFDVVDALFSNTENGEMNLLAAVEALERTGNTEIVRVDGDDETVRIWIDAENGESSSESEGESD